MASAAAMASLPSMGVAIALCEIDGAMAAYRKEKVLVPIDA